MSCVYAATVLGKLDYLNACIRSCQGKSSIVYEIILVMVGEGGIEPPPHVPKTWMPSLYTIPRYWWTGPESNWLPHGLQPCTLPASSTVHCKIMVEERRVELRILGCRPSVFPLALFPHWGNRMELNHLKQGPQPCPSPFGFGYVYIWSTRLEFNQRRPAYKAGACSSRPQVQTFIKWSRQQESDLRRLLTKQLHYHCAIATGAGRSIRTTVTRLRGARSAH